MGIEFIKRGESATVVTATERLWLTADSSRLVADGDLLAAFLFCVPGDELPVEEAERYGLLPPAASQPAAEADAEPEPVTEPPKWVRPAADKRRKRGEDK